MAEKIRPKIVVTMYHAPNINAASHGECSMIPRIVICNMGVMPTNVTIEPAIINSAVSLISS